MRLFYIMPELSFITEKALYLYSKCGVNLIDKDYSSYNEMKREINSAFLDLAPEEVKTRFCAYEVYGMADAVHGGSFEAQQRY